MPFIFGTYKLFQRNVNALDLKYNSYEIKYVYNLLYSRMARQLYYMVETIKMITAYIIQFVYRI